MEKLRSSEGYLLGEHFLHILRALSPICIYLVVSLPKMQLMGFLLQHRAEAVLPHCLCFRYSHPANNEVSVVKVE